MTGMPTGTDTTTLAKEPFINITTFRRDGTPVSTPVWFVTKNHSLLVYTEADSGKVKRIRHDPHVTVAPCDFRGKPRGPAADADATIVHDTEEVAALLRRKYPWTWRGYKLSMAAMHRVRRQAPPESVTIRIALR